jgi:ABC-2 type transport system ATP-binding protein
MSAIVQTEHLTKDFAVGFWRPRPRRALDDVTLDLQRGEVFGLLGPNGAGKTTTLKLLMRLLWPTSGRAELFGRPVGDRLAHAKLGFLPEQPIFYDHLTADELLGYFAGLFGLTGPARRARVASVLDLVGLAEADRRRPLRQFSKGMLQRVGLAQALVNDPELVLLDEPMSGLDPIGRRDVRELILRLRDDGRTVLFSSHILSDAEAVCSRVGILSRGRLVACGALTALTDAAGRGWELIVANLDPERAVQLEARCRRVHAIAAGRYSLELGPDVRPEPLIADLSAAGVLLVSVNPLRSTLEDVFVERVGAPAPVGERGLGPGGQ